MRCWADLGGCPHGAGGVRVMWQWVLKPEQVSELKCSEENASAGGTVQSEACSTSDWEGVCLCEQPSIECWTQASVDDLYVEGTFRMGSWGWKDCPYKGVVPSGVSEHGQDEKGPFPVGYPSLGVGASSEWREYTEIVAVGVAWHRTSEPEKSEESFCSVDSTGAVMWDWL